MESDLSAQCDCQIIANSLQSNKAPTENDDREEHMSSQNCAAPEVKKFETLSNSESLQRRHSSYWNDVESSDCKAKALSMKCMSGERICLIPAEAIFNISQQVVDDMTGREIMNESQFENHKIAQLGSQLKGIRLDEMIERGPVNGVPTHHGFGTVSESIYGSRHRFPQEVGDIEIKEQSLKYLKPSVRSEPEASVIPIMTCAPSKQFSFGYNKVKHVTFPYALSKFHEIGNSTDTEDTCPHLLELQNIAPPTELPYATIQNMTDFKTQQSGNRCGYQVYNRLASPLHLPYCNETATQIDSIIDCDQSMLQTEISSSHFKNHKQTKQLIGDINLLTEMSSATSEMPAIATNCSESSRADNCLYQSISGSNSSKTHNHFSMLYSNPCERHDIFLTDSLLNRNDYTTPPTHEDDLIACALEYVEEQLNFEIKERQELDTSPISSKVTCPKITMSVSPATTTFVHSSETDVMQLLHFSESCYYPYKSVPSQKLNSDTLSAPSSVEVAHSNGDIAISPCKKYNTHVSSEIQTSSECFLYPTVDSISQFNQTTSCSSVEELAESLSSDKTKKSSELLNNERERVHMRATKSSTNNSLLQVSATNSTCIQGCKICRISSSPRNFSDTIYAEDEFEEISVSKIMEAEKIVKSYKDADMITQDSQGDTSLHVTMIDDDWPLVEAILNRLIRTSLVSHVINVRNQLQQTPLCLAVICNKPRIVEMLVENGADVNVHIITSHDNLGPKFCNPLHFAASRGHLWKETLRQLVIANNAKLDAFNSDGKSPLHCAIEGHGKTFNDAIIDSKDTLRILCEKGANLNQPDCGHEKTPLHYAIERRDVELVTRLLLLATKFSPDRDRCTVSEMLEARTGNGNTALHLAASVEMNTVDHKKLIQQLMSKGADPSSKNGDGFLPRELTKNREVVELLKGRTVSQRVVFCDKKRKS